VSGRDRARTVARIARWEVSRSVGVLDRRTLLAALVVVLVAGTVVGATVAVGGASLDRGIYRVGVAADDPYHEPVAASPTLDARPPSDAAFEVGRLDLLVADRSVRVADSQKGEAALSSFREAVRTHNERLMAAEDNRSAAFPVFVDLQYRTQDSTVVVAGSDGAGGQGVSGDSDAGSGGDGSGADDAGAGDDGESTSTSIGTGDGPLGIPNVGTGLFGGGQSGSPADIAPPFPFSSLVLAFAFLVPMNFVIQAYGGTILNERVNRRGELLLVAPVAAADIVAGKTVPYLAAMIGVSAVIAFVVGGGVVALAAVVPIALLYLAATFVGGMFARSFKELTFVSVSVSVFLTTYTFVPAIFTNVTPVALISPLTLVVRDLQGVGVSATQYAFSTGPVYAVAGSLFVLGVGVYREEDMFTQRSVPLKFVDALDARIRGRLSAAKLSAFAIPFVFVAELLAVAVLFALPGDVSVPLLLVAIAGVEEVAKSIHVYAGFAKSRFERTLRAAVFVGTLSGVGFFVGEKAFVVAQAVGLSQVPLGRAAFETTGVGPGVAVGLLFAPLALHVVTASTTALGAARNRRWYAATLAVGTLVHAGYNLTVVSALG
jgi:ABC-type Na+ efflux pump permease subunit